MSKYDNILKVIEYYDLTPNYNISDKFKIPCPFHSDDTASCYIDTNRNTYYCFGCGKQGDTLSFIQNAENINSLQAMKLFNQIDSNKSGKDIVVKRVPIINSKQAIKEAKIYFYSISKPSWQYIKKSYMHERGFDSKILISNDIKINPDTQYGIICPIKDCGKYKGYVKRRTDGNDKECKYLYNRGFRRNTVILGDYDIGGWIPLTEGYMDWLKLRQYGCDNAGAIFGWEITTKQIAKLQKHTNCIISALDNTKTGEDGTKKLEEYFHVVRFQFPENCKDVGELTRIQFNKAWNDTMIQIEKYKNKMKKKGVQL
jgi:DNA primase